MSGNVMERCCASGAGIAAGKAEEAALAAQKAAKSVAEAVDLAASAVEIARNAERILDMAATAEALDTGENPTAEYDKIANVMHFGLPKGNTGDKGDKGDPPTMRGEVAEVSGLPASGAEGDAWFTSEGDLYYWNAGATEWRLVTNLRGPVGPAISIKGTQQSEADLPANGESGDSWLIDGELWVWSESDQIWVNVGRIQGPAGMPETALSGLFGTAASSLKAGRAGDFGYVEGLGVYKFHPDSETPVDGEWCIAPAYGSGRWIMVLPSVDTTFALAQRINDTMPLTVSRELTWTAIAAGGSQTRAAAIPGAVVNSPCFVAGPRLVGGLALSASVTADETVTVKMDNYSAASVTPASGTYIIKIFTS